MRSLISHDKNLYEGPSDLQDDAMVQAWFIGFVHMKGKKGYTPPKPNIDTQNDAIFERRYILIKHHHFWYLC